MTPDNIRNIENIGFVLASISSILFSSKPYNILDAFSFTTSGLDYCVLVSYTLHHPSCGSFPHLSQLW